MNFYYCEILQGSYDVTIIVAKQREADIAMLFLLSGKISEKRKCAGHIAQMGLLIGTGENNALHLPGKL